ncbi:hypothetical protein KY339_06065 [Candidatus Woesearchaeota archaeon]|nr:hypothetical protein [Candidatus Woesearchaeota archaeon]
MEQRIIRPKDYHLILLTDVPKNSFKINSIVERYKAEERNPDVRFKAGERVQDVLLAPAKNYKGLLVLDGNARVAASGRIKRGIESYICDSEDDIAKINYLMGEMKLVTGASLLRNFLMGIESFDDMILKGEKKYEEKGMITLRKYLRRY